MTTPVWAEPTCAAPLRSPAVSSYNHIFSVTKLECVCLQSNYRFMLSCCIMKSKSGGNVWLEFLLWGTKQLIYKDLHWSFVRGDEANQSHITLHSIIPMSKSEIKQMTEYRSAGIWSDNLFSVPCSSPQCVWVFAIDTLAVFHRYVCVLWTNTVHQPSDTLITSTNTGSNIKSQSSWCQDRKSPVKLDCFCFLSPLHRFLLCCLLFLFFLTD